MTKCILKISVSDSIADRLYAPGVDGKTQKGIWVESDAFISATERNKNQIHPCRNIRFFDVELKDDLSSACINVCLGDETIQIKTITKDDMVDGKIIDIDIY